VEGVVPRAGLFQRYDPDWAAAGDRWCNIPHRPVFSHPGGQPLCSHIRQCIYPAIWRMRRGIFLPVACR